MSHSVTALSSFNCGGSYLSNYF